MGIDLITERIEKAVAKVIKRNLKNLFFKAEPKEFLEPCDRKITDSFVMYPDPWPEQRHHKRRLLQSPFFEILAYKTE